MRHLDLFSGIGGFALAARRVGWETVGFCEIDKYCQKVLRKHWPDVPIYDDVKELTSEQTGSADIITAGFPCQDISVAGKGAGLAGERSGLFYDTARIISDVGPRLVILENVSALLVRGLDDVLGRMAEIGYDCEWHCIPASAVGAPHRRDRIWIIAYASGHALRDQPGRRIRANGKGQTEPGHDGEKEPLADAKEQPIRAGLRESEPEGQRRGLSADSGGPIGRDPGCQLLEGWQPQGPTDRSCLRHHAGWWATEPDVGRVANGIPARVDRLRGLGNAIVPQVAEAIFREIAA